MLKRIGICLMLVPLFLSCSPYKKIPYLQDIKVGETMPINNSYTNIIKSGDLLNIVVSSTEAVAALPFNLYSVRSQIGDNTNNSMTTRQELEGYMVNSDGDIDYPVLGTLHVAGMTRQELSGFLKAKLMDYMENPIVTVNYVNFKITVAGEVNKPGVLNIYGDRVSVLEALGMAGDMTIYGNRSNILIIRENDGVRVTEQLDITSKKIFDSDFFYLQQNDVIIVEPIKQKARTISPFINNLPLITSLGSLAASLTTVILSILSLR